MTLRLPLLNTHKLIFITYDVYQCWLFQEDSSRLVSDVVFALSSWAKKQTLQQHDAFLIYSLGFLETNWLKGYTPFPFLDWLVHDLNAQVYSIVQHDLYQFILMIIQSEGHLKLISDFPLTFYTVKDTLNDSKF